MTSVSLLGANDPAMARAAIWRLVLFLPSIPEDGEDSTSIQLPPAFEDEDLDVLTFSSDRDGASKQNIKVEIDSEGNVTLTPDDNWNGAEDITFYADDGTGTSPTGGDMEHPETTALASYFILNVSSVNDSGQRLYSVDLPVPFIALQGEKYWLVTQAVFEDLPK